MSQPHRKKKKNSFLDLVWEYKFTFVVYILLISAASFIFLYAIGGVPNELKSGDEGQSSKAIVRTEPGISQVDLSSNLPTVKTSGNITVRGELPARVIIDKVGINASVSNPISQNVNDLNSALLHGAARYPGSGVLGSGNLFILGHSTSIKIVNNQAYKTFNGLGKLSIGDIIRVQSDTREYTYKVSDVSLVRSDQAYIDLKDGSNMLTLVTCNVLGEKAERFLVEAEYASVRPL